MADRTVTVRLRALVDDYQSAMGKASKATTDLGDKVKKSGRDNKAEMQQLGVAGLAAGAVLAGGFAVAVRSSMEFDKTLSNLAAVSGATSSEMGTLRQAALDAGAATVFSASEAAEAQSELAKAGVSVSEILGGALAGTLDLAAAGSIDLANAATVAAQAMNVFGLQGSEVTMIADTLAAGANKSAAGVDDLGQALRQGGGVAAATGLSLGETVAALSAFADSALVGSDAGTSLKSMLQRLTPQSKEAANLMAELGFTAYDAAGEFVGLEALAGNLQNAFAGMSTEQRSSAMATLFGSDAVRAANVLYVQGASGIRGYVDAVDDQGAAARVAATNLDNLAGDVEALAGSIDTALIQTGGKANGVLREMAQAATAVVNVYNSAPPMVQATAVALAGVGGATLLVGGAALIAVPRIVALNAAMLTATGGAVGLRVAMTALSKAGIVGAIGVGTVLGVEAFTKAVSRSAPEVNGLTRSLLAFEESGKTTGALARVVGDDFIKVGEKVRQANLNRAFSFDLKSSQRDIVGARNELKSLDEALASLVNGGRAKEAAEAFLKVSDSAKAAGVSQEDLSRQFTGYQSALDQASIAASNAGGSVNGLAAEQEAAAAATMELRDATNEVTLSLDDQAEAIESQFDPLVKMQRALRSQAEAQDAAAKAVKEHGSKSVEAKDAQFALLESSVGVTSAAKKLQAQYDSGAISINDATAQIKAWSAQGLITKDQAAGLARQIGGLASSAAELSATPAVLGVSSPGLQGVLGSVNALDRQLDALSGRVVQVSVRVAGATALNGIGRGLRGGITANGGGLIPGAGNTDTVPAMLTPGEFVLRKSAVASIGLSTLAAMNGGSARLTPAPFGASGAAPAARSAGQFIDYARLASAVAGAMSGVSIRADGREIARAVAPHAAAESARYARRG